MPSSKHPFQAAVEARDFEALLATLTPSVVFHTPIRFQAFEGRGQAAIALRLAADAFAFQTGFAYRDTVGRDDVLALFFEARIGDRTLEGVDLLRLDEADQVRELTVMMRPFSAVQDVVRVTGEMVSCATGAAEQAP